MNWLHSPAPSFTVRYIPDSRQVSAGLNWTVALGKLSERDAISAQEEEENC